MGFFDLSILDDYVRDNSGSTEEKTSLIVHENESERVYWEPAPSNILESNQDGFPRPFKWRMEDESDGARHLASDGVSTLEEPRLGSRKEAATPVSARGWSNDPVLSREQCEVMELVIKGENVFFTGPGGTGKSFVLKCVIATLKEKFSAPHSQTNLLGGNCGCFSCNVAVTASTGIAALAIGGSTLHSATGIGIPRRIRDYGRMFHKELRAKWRRMKVLIIDEVSMISAETLEYLEQTLRRLRGMPGNENSADQSPSVVETPPFGGLQVILAGDFFQLLPVVIKDCPGRIQSWDELTNRGLAFQAPAWHMGNFRTIFLTRAFRQDKEDEFVTLLEDIRTGRNPNSVDKIVQNCERMLPYQHGIKPTKLFPRSQEVKELNDKELARLCSHEEVYISIDSYETVEAGLLTGQGSSQSDAGVQELYDIHKGILEGHIFWRYCQAERIVRLKVGAQVMLLRNLRRPGSRLSLVNGSRGVIVGWTTKEKALADLSTRAKAVGDPFGRTKFEYEPVKCLERSDLFVIPRVKFRNGETVDILPMSFNHEVVDVGECQRIQIPLKLAWAITIHKSQGMTLDYAKVALSGVFAEGQTYVALSRVKSMDSLQVLNTNHSRSIVRVNKDVKAYFEELENGTGKKPKIMKFRTISPLYTGVRKSDDSTKDESDKASKQLSTTTVAQEKHLLNAHCKSSESKVLQKFNQHRKNPSGSSPASGNPVELDSEKLKVKEGVEKFEIEKGNDICTSGNSFGAGEGIVTSAVTSSDKTTNNVPRDSNRVTEKVARNASLPTGIGNLSLGSAEIMPANISSRGSALAIEMQSMLDLYEDEPSCADQQRTKQGRMMERREKDINEEMPRKVQYILGRVKVELDGNDSVQAKVDPCADSRQDHTEFTNEELRANYHLQLAEEGSRNRSAALLNGYKKAKKSERVAPCVVAVKLEHVVLVPAESARIMDNNVSGRSKGGSKSKRQRESADPEKDERPPRKQAKKPRADRDFVKGKYPRKLGSTAKSPRQTQTIDVEDVPGVPRESGQVSLDSRKAPSTWSRIVTTAEDCVCYFCHKVGHFASDCTEVSRRKC